MVQQVCLVTALAASRPHFQSAASLNGHTSAPCCARHQAAASAGRACSPRQCRAPHFDEPGHHVVCSSKFSAERLTVTQMCAPLFSMSDELSLNNCASAEFELPALFTTRQQRRVEFGLNRDFDFINHFCGDRWHAQERLQSRCVTTTAGASRYCMPRFKQLGS